MEPQFIFISDISNLGWGVAVAEEEDIETVIVKEWRYNEKI
jgi:hypothetical protein